ncbi:MAG TPA: YncE family protein, partial [Anaeromyxobacteraceae bacterium]|nr:YncE family protein [Anaeromyxobacteraceae bacterium]
MHALAALIALVAAADVDPNHLVRSGVAVDFSIRRLGAASGAGQPLMEGDYAEVRFRMVDATTGRPMTGVKPAAWMDIGGVGPGGEQRECKDKVGLYLKGIVGIRPMVDLNSYYLLVLNQDPSISVIDPVVSMTGRTSLYATVLLKRPPADWARSGDAKRIYVSMPRAGEVAVVDGEAFKVQGSVPAGPDPVRVALQGDGRYLWVGNDSREPGESGVTVIDTETLAPVARIVTGRGHHEIAFSADDRHAFVSNRDEGSVSVVDVATLRKVRDVRTGPVPIALAFSPLSGALYVADGREGTIAVVDGTGLEVTARIATRPGLGPLRVSRDGRWAIAVNPAENAAYVVDTSLNRLAHTIPARGKPYQVAFTRAFAYLRLLDSERVVMVNLGS